MVASIRVISQEQADEEKFRADSIHILTPKAIRLQFKFDTRATVYKNQAIHIYGYDAGVMVKEKIRMTLGYYRIDEQLPNQTDINKVVVAQNLYVRCGTINTELIYLRKRFFSLGFPLEIGLGYYRVKSMSIDSDAEIARLEGITGFSNFGLAGTFTPIRWFGLKAIVGYRKAVLSSDKRFDFNGIFSSIALNVELHEIIKDIKMYHLKKKYYKADFKPFQAFTDILTN
ncbi:MAG: hypothetical protein ACXVPN_10445 [Bacteroidia bacterium]